MKGLMIINGEQNRGVYEQVSEEKIGPKRRKLKRVLKNT
jgi:hypothetical protein